MLKYNNLSNRSSLRQPPRSHLGQLGLGVDCYLTKVTVVAGAEGGVRPGLGFPSRLWFGAHYGLLLLLTVVNQLLVACMGFLKIHTKPSDVKCMLEFDIDNTITIYCLHKYLIDLWSAIRHLFTFSEAPFDWL